MQLSVIVRSLNEAPRLRLALASYLGQAEGAEIVVVDDGSEDDTQRVLRDYSGRLPLQVVRHASPQGRSAASNAGAMSASGDVLLFMDGDTLAGPGLLKRHAAFHEDNPLCAARGDTFHLRGTRFFLDPATGTAQIGAADRVAAMTSDELNRNLVTISAIREDFPQLHQRSQPGIYPGHSARRLYELEVEALQSDQDLHVLWAAASGQNLSVPRMDFLEAGMFDTEISINEHRELAYRLCQRGVRMRFAPDARSYHMTHRTGWRDPLREREWEDIFFRKHGDPAIKLLIVLWAGLSEQGRFIPNALQINSLKDLQRAARSSNPERYDALRRRILDGDTGVL